MSTSSPAPEELQDLLSAYLDDEVTDAERQQVEELLETDPAVRSELEGLASTRSLVRSLPEVEPRKVLPHFERSTVAPVAPRKRTLPWVATAAFAVAAVWLLVIGLVGNQDLGFTPDVEALSLRHASATESPEAGGYEVMDTDEISMPGFAPMTIGHDMEREGVYQNEKLVHIMFSDSEHVVSVFYEPGSVNWDDMPIDGEMMKMDGKSAWHQVSDAGNVLVTEKEGQVVTIVADADMGDDMVFSIPDLLV